MDIVQEKERIDEFRAEVELFSSKVLDSSQEYLNDLTHLKPKEIAFQLDIYTADNLLITRFDDVKFGTRGRTVYLKDTISSECINEGKADHFLLINKEDPEFTVEGTCGAAGQHINRWTYFVGLFKSIFSKEDGYSYKKYDILFASDFFREKEIMNISFFSFRPPI